MSSKLGEERNFILKGKSILGCYRVLLAVPKTSLEKFTVTVVQEQQLPTTEKTDHKDDSFWLKWTRDTGRRNLNEFLKADLDNLRIVVHWNRNNIYLN